MILVGRGSTTVWNDAGQRITFEWKAGALFAIPLNCWHQHFNGSGRDAGALRLGDQRADRHQSLRGLRFHLRHQATTSRAASTASRIISRAKDETKGFLLATNFVPDAVNLPLITAKERGAGGGHIRFNFAKSSLNSHISQFPIGTYKKAHAHGPGAHVIILSGEGYSLMWPEGDEPRYYKWEVGTMIVPPNMWLHQHFNTGTTPARYLAFKHEGVAIRNAQGVPKAWISKRHGGDQIDYPDENPETRKQFAQELAKHGLTSQMDKAYAAEKADGCRRQDRRRRGESTCMTFPARRIGTSRPAASAPASASSAGRRRPTTSSWSRKASRCSATSASARCRTCRWRRGSAPAAAAPTSSSTAPKANGAATSSRCRAPARSIPRSTSTRKSISSSKAAARPRSGSTTTTSATCSNGRRARCSRSR